MKARLPTPTSGLGDGKEAWISHTHHRWVQLGAVRIYCGVRVLFFRNATGHNLVESYTQEDALRFVAFVDLLLGMVGKVAEQRRGDGGA